MIDINRLADLGGIDADNGTVRIGAVTRQRECESSPRLRSAVPLFVEAVGYVAHPSVRLRGTAVGSVAFADPSAELPAVLLALDGQVMIRSTRGERVVEADDFFTGPFATSLAPDELAVALRIPRTRNGRTGSAFVEESRRHGELPMCGVGAIVTLDEDGSVAAVQIALCGVHRRPIRAREAEAALAKTRPNDKVLREVAALAAAATEPVGDSHASAAFRRHLAAVLTRRALDTAVSRAVAREEAQDA